MLEGSILDKLNLRYLLYNQEEMSNRKFDIFIYMSQEKRGPEIEIVVVQAVFKVPF